MTSTRTQAGVLLALLFPLAAACGGSGGGSGDRVASVGSPTATASAGGGATPKPGDEKEAMLKYAQCMRQNGVPTFPDPQFNGEGGVSLDLPEGADPKAVDAAQGKCKELMPNGGENQKVDPAVTEKLRQYAKCMREHGIPQFPDPAPNGGLQINNDQLGFGPDDPKFTAADEACAQYMPQPPGGGAGKATRNAGGNPGSSA